MSTKTNDPKQTAPETDPTAEDVKTDTAAPAEEAEEALRSTRPTRRKPKKKRNPRKRKRRKKKRSRADLAAEKDKYLRLLAEYDNYRRRST